MQIIDTRTESLARKVSTNADGEFTVTLLPPGTYSVVVNKVGLREKAKSERNREVHVTETVRVTHLS